MKQESSIKTDIVLVDIIGFSKLNSREQLEIIKYLTNSYVKLIRKMLDNSNMQLDDFIEGYIATGDGFFCILHEEMRGYGTILGLNFTHLSSFISKKYPYFQGVKIAIHTGEIYQFTDILGNKNYIGDGLNDCARYLEIKNFSISTVMVSQEAYDNLRIFLTQNVDFNQLFIEYGFQHSKMHEFKDKHSKVKHGCLVWLRNSKIISLPN